MNQPDATKDEALEAFKEWFIENYPSRCIITDPAWHAPKIFRKAKAALENLAPRSETALSVPAGWKIVPCELTEPMRIAGYLYKDKLVAQALYRALLDAAPQAPDTARSEPTAVGHPTAAAPSVPSATTTTNAAPQEKVKAAQSSSPGVVPVGAAPVKVWAVLKHYRYEGDDLVAILGSKEEAEKVAARIQTDEDFAPDSMKVQEWAIGEVNE